MALSLPEQPVLARLVAVKLAPLRVARRLVIVCTVTGLLLMPGAIYSCGPFFDEAIFVPSGAPQVSQADFAAGKLGILLPTLRRSYLVVAYRYLNGLKLDGKKQKDVIDVWNRNMAPAPPPIVNEHLAIDAWLKAREQVESAPQIGSYDPYSAISAEQPYQSFLNCPDDAFQTARVTLTLLIQKYSAKSAAVKGWLGAQDQVFSNCDGKTRAVPSVLDSTDPLLRADRNYQIAAAQFYQRLFDEAAEAFETIASDPASPWASYGQYLAARALIRKATLGSAADGKFDAVPMKAAEQKLEQLLRDPQLAKVHTPAARLLDYIHFRTEPEKRVAELEQSMLKPDPGPDFKQHLWDYVLLVSQGEQAEDLSDWLKTFYSDRTYQHPLGLIRPTDQASAKHAVAQWRAGHSLPWLIAALDFTAPDDPSTSELLQAASQVPASSPGYLTAHFYALRMMVPGKPQEARHELDRLLGHPEADLPHGTRNLLEDERQKLSINLMDFLTHAAEVPARIGVAWDGGDEAGDEEPREGENAKPEKQKVFFNDYAAQILAQKLPLSLLLDSAKSLALPPNLRRELARSTWIRAVVLGDFATADHLQPVLEELDTPLWRAMQPFRLATRNEDKRFSAALLTLENPGLSPYVRAGLLRGSTLGEIDNYRDNWWCEPAPDEAARLHRDRRPDISAPAFLSQAELTEAQKEVAEVRKAAIAPNFLNREVLTYAELYPEDERVPQALHLAVRATRYGCTDSETTRWSEKSFRLLHQRYPKSEWAEKTKYHY